MVYGTQVYFSLTSRAMGLPPSVFDKTSVDTPGGICFIFILKRVSKMKVPIKANIILVKANFLDSNMRG